MRERRWWGAGGGDTADDFCCVAAKIHAPAAGSRSIYHATPSASRQEWKWRSHASFPNVGLGFIFMEKVQILSLSLSFLKSLKAELAYQ